MISSHKGYKSKSKVIAINEFHTFLGGYMHAKRKTPIEFAASLGITPQLVYMLLNGKRPPSAKILKACGLESAYVTPGSPDSIAPSELQMLVMKKMWKSKMRLDEYAEHIGIHKQTLYTIISGIRLAPKSLIKKLGMKAVYRTI